MDYPLFIFAKKTCLGQDIHLLPGEPVVAGEPQDPDAALSPGILAAQAVLSDSHDARGR